MQSANAVCRSNCSWYGVAHVQVDTGAPQVTLRGNGYFAGATTIIGASDAAAVTGAVAFVNPAQLDYRVEAGSNSIDRGETLADVPLDYVGASRPIGSAVDLGAFEVPGGAPVLPTAPRNLRIVR